MSVSPSAPLSGLLELHRRPQVDDGADPEVDEMIDGGRREVMQRVAAEHHARPGRGAVARGQTAEIAEVEDAVELDEAVFVRGHQRAAEGGAGVDDELTAGDLARAIGEQPHHRVGHVGRVGDPPQGHAALGLLVGVLVEGAGEHRRPHHPAGVHRVHPHPDRTQLARAVLRQAAHRPLAGAVARQARVRHHPRGRRDVDDGAAAGRRHRPARALHPEPHAHHVDVEQPGELLR